MAPVGADDGELGVWVHNAEKKKCSGTKEGTEDPDLEQPAEIPGKPFRGPNAPERAYKHLEDYHGVSRDVARNRLHKLKELGNLGAADDVVIGKTGDVYNAATGEHLGFLTDKTLGN